MSGPSTAPPPDPGDLPPAVAAELVKKVVSSAALAVGMAWNATKPDEYGEYARTPTEGITVKSTDVLTDASTVSERSSSAKTGAGLPPAEAHALDGCLDRVRVNNGGSALTTNHVLGFRIVDAGVDAYAAVAHVRPRDPAQFPHHAGVRGAHLSPDRRGG